jgi:hypothetical protein
MDDPLTFDPFQLATFYDINFDQFLFTSTAMKRLVFLYIELQSNSVIANSSGPDFFVRYNQGSLLPNQFVY